MEKIKKLIEKIPGHIRGYNLLLWAAVVVTVGFKTHSLHYSSWLFVAMFLDFCGGHSVHLDQPDHRREKPPTPLERFLQWASAWFRYLAILIIVLIIIFAF